MSDGIIDFGEYQRKKQEEAEPERTMFAIWGGEGERTRFALPLWRAAGLVGGSRALLAFERPPAPDGTVALEALVVLDLAADPARLDVPAGPIEALRERVVAPGLARAGGALAVHLGEEGGRRFHLLVDEVPDGTEREPLPVNELYFLAGECAGLLFHHSLASDEDP